MWQDELASDKDKHFLLEGIKHGFYITDKHQTVRHVEQKNHTSALKSRVAEEKELIDQINKGHYIVASQKPSVISALAAIPKDDNSVRLIHDGSKPVGHAMNDYSVPETVKFLTLAD